MTGSVLWNLFSREVSMVENSWNVSFRSMYNLPLQTHRYLVEPISNATHIQSQLYKRFLGFVSRLEKCNKSVIRTLFSSVGKDTNSTTGYNLRKLLLKTDKYNKEDINSDILKYLLYKTIPGAEIWRISLITELLEWKYENASLNNFTQIELQNILNNVCTS